MLQAKFSQARQRRLLEGMQQRRLDAVVVGLPHHVYYFSAVLPHWLQSAAVVLRADGRSTLITANASPQNAAVDEAIAFEATWLGTQRQEQPAVVAEKVMDSLGSDGSLRVG